MSQISKKGKSLSRKHNTNNNTKKKETKNSCQSFKEDFCRKPKNLFSLSIKHENKEDDSLLSLDTPLKYGSSSTNRGEEINVSYKTESCLPNNYIFIKEQLQEGEAQTTESKTIFEDETILENPSDVFSFHKERNNLLEDSSHVFENVDDGENSKSTTYHVNNRGKNHGSSTDSNTFLDDDVLISDLTRIEHILVKNNAGGTVEESSNQSQNQCPICFKTVTNYINHMKSCASKNNLTTQQLLSLLKLHKKQLAERKELGLGLPISSFRAKVSPKKSKVVDRKKPIDSNLQLALALSASLQSAEEDEVIQEAEALKEAGLTEEADKKLSTLEKFGFASDFPCGSRTVQRSAKSRLLAPSLLLKRTKEDRERIVTEKVAIILINEEENNFLDTFVEKIPSIKSKLLLNLWMEDCVLWNKAQCPSEEQRSAFYIQALCRFIEPSTAEVGEGLRRLSQLPGRLNTPVKYDISKLVTPPRIQSFSGKKKSLSSASTIRRYSASSNKTNLLSKDWKTLVGNSVLSDISVHCDQGQVVPAHKLVFYVRCPSILNIAESSSSVTDCRGNSRDKIILPNCSKRSALAFLEFVYTGTSRKLLYLSPQEFQTVVGLANKFNYGELKHELVFMRKSRENVERKKSGEKEVSKELFLDHLNTQNNAGNSENEYMSNLPTKHESSNFELKIRSDSVDCSNSSSVRCSPDMFGDSSMLESKTNSPERDDLDILASLVGKTTGVQEEDNSINLNYSCAFDEVKDSSNALTLSGSASMKRKTLSSSFSEDENTSLCKKVCIDLSPKTNISEHGSEERETLDLTQSSNSSKRESPTIDQAEFEDDNSDDCKIVSPTELQEDYLENLTQKYPPSNSLSTEILSPRTRDSEDSLNNVGPMWDGYEDDCWYYNYEFKTPSKICEESLVKNSNSKYSSASKRPEQINIVSTLLPKISSDSKSPSKTSKKYLSPNNVSSVVSPSSKDKTPSNFSQKTLDIYMSPNTIAESQTVTHSVINLEQEDSSTPKNLKAKKNLNSQFFTIADVEKPKNDSSFYVNTKGHKALSPVHSITNSPTCREGMLSKTPTTLFKKGSLAAIQRLLDDSFEVNNSILASADALSSAPGEKFIGKDNIAMSYPSTSLLINTNQTTPPPEIYVSDKVTPLLDYSSMKTPALKKELTRFGLKPSLGRKKGKLLLRHIYEQTHPFVPESLSQTKDVFKQPPKSPVKKSHEIHDFVHLADSESEVEETCSQNSTCSTLSSSTTLPEERSFESEEELLTQTQSSEGDIRTSIRNFIVNNPDLHKKILMYEPIFLEDLREMLKSKGIRCKSDQIIDFLDEQCITFRTTSWKARNEKRRKKLKNLKKNTIVKKGECSRNDFSPTKTQPSQIKKRGRPKKISK